jgi:hypothetical protein
VTEDTGSKARAFQPLPSTVGVTESDFFHTVGFTEGHPKNPASQNRKDGLGVNKEGGSHVAKQLSSKMQAPALNHQPNRGP